MPAPLTRLLDPPGPIDLRLTLRNGIGPRDPCSHREGEAMWRATRTPEGPATVKVEAGDRLLATAWGPGARDALERLPAWLGFDDDPEALVPRDDVVARAKRAHPGLRLGCGRPIFEVLVPVILGQRVTTQEASDAWRGLVVTYGERAPGPRKLYVPPAPETLARLGLPTFHRFGVEGARARVVLDVCHHRRFVESAVALPPAEAIRKLRMIRGIGPWTSHLTVALVMGYPDALPLGDVHIPSVVARALTGEERATDRRMVELLAPYRGQRWRVIRLVGADSRYATRRAPRRAPWRVQVDLATARRRRGARSS